MEQIDPAPIRCLEAPTGLGKTLATLVGWLWDRRQRPDTTPRRLVYQLPLRTLTEQIAEECRKVIARMGLAVPVYVLRGGQIDNDYADALAAEAVIVGSLDQVVKGAGALFRHPGCLATARRQTTPWAERRRLRASSSRAQGGPPQTAHPGRR